MVKILEEGKIKHTKRCKYCECLFEFEASDITNRTVYDDHGGHYPVADFTEISCPFCNKTLGLNDNEFTKEERDKFKQVSD